MKIRLEKMVLHSPTDKFLILNPFLLNSFTDIAQKLSQKEYILGSDYIFIF